MASAGMACGQWYLEVKFGKNIFGNELPVDLSQYKVPAVSLDPNTVVFPIYFSYQLQGCSH